MMSAGCLDLSKLCILITVIVAQPLAAATFPNPSVSVSDLPVPQVASGTLISSLLTGQTQLIN